MKPRKSLKRRKGILFYILIIGAKGSINLNLIAIQAQKLANARNASSPVYKYSYLNAIFHEQMETAIIKVKIAIFPMAEFKTTTV